MKAITLLCMACLCAAATGQDKLIEQKRKFDAARKAALVQVEKEHVTALLEIGASYKKAGDSLRAEMAYKAADEFLAEKFHGELAGSRWVRVVEEDNGSDIKFDTDGVVTIKSPHLNITAEYKVTNLTTLEFKHDRWVWVMTFDFAKGKVRVDKMENGKKILTFDMVRGV